MHPDLLPTQPSTQTSQSSAGETSLAPRPTCPQVIWEEIARRLVRGQKQSDIAADLQRSPSSVCNTIRHPEFQAILTKARTVRDEKLYAVEEHFQTHLRSACQTISDLLDDDQAPHGVRLSAARDVIRHAGFAPKSSQIPPPGQVNIENLTFEQRVELSSKSSQDVLDAEWEEDQDLLQAARKFLPSTPQNPPARSPRPTPNPHCTEETGHAEL